MNTLILVGIFLFILPSYFDFAEGRHNEQRQVSNIFISLLPRSVTIYEATTAAIPFIRLCQRRRILLSSL